ncbi:MAG: sulfatase-like hydrolase/transferase, partial [Planctomycetota bacterium]
DDLETPAVDGLAARGVRFTQFYAAAPVCSPSRAGLLTGRYPWRVGLPGNAGAGPSEEIDDLSESNAKGGLHDEAVTLAERFAAAGYRTAHIGKWHLGHRPGAKPLDQGFEYSFGHMCGCIDNYAHFFYWNGPNRHDLWENNARVRMPGQFFPDLMVDKAVEFIKRPSDEPFLIYFASNAPHYPYQGDDKWLRRYAALPYPRNLYAAFLSTLDERVGRLLKALEDVGAHDNTIVVYQSDNGHSTEARAHFGGGSAGPYRGAKFSLFEGGIRLPAIISWPAALPHGAVRDQMAHACDWAPTLLALCEIEASDDEFDGRSLVDVLHSAEAASPHGPVHWDLSNQWAVREGPWKLIHNVRPTAGPELAKADREWFLANVVDDPSETRNHAADEPQIVAKLRERHAEMRASERP